MRYFVFIHSSYIEHLYSAPSSLLRSAPNSSAAKKNSLQTRKEVKERKSTKHTA